MDTTYERASFRDANGTSLQGYLRATRDEIVSAFGPSEDGPFDKSNYEWVMLLPIDGLKVVVTVYDWKTTPFASDREYDWHIGGHSERAVAAIESVFPGRTS